MGKWCTSRYRHGIASDVNQTYISRDADRSILWTMMIRHPAPRVMSEFFFFRVSREKWNATEDSILQNIGQPNRFKSYTVDYLKLKEIDTKEEEIEL